MNPDLVVDMGGGTTNPFAGSSFPLYVSVRNEGTAPSTSTTLRYYRSTDTTISSSDTEVGTDSVPGINGGNAFSRQSINLTAPSTPDIYYYGACVDAVSGESDTTNNCSTALRVTVRASSDLVITDLRVSNSSSAAGAYFTLNVTVLNQGIDSSESALLRFYRSADATITTADTSDSIRSISSLDPSESGGKSITLTAPDSPGTYYYGACVEGVDNEVNTGNNCSAAVRVTVVDAPDLILTVLDCIICRNQFDRRVLVGTSIRLTAHLGNRGSVESNPTMLRYYLSTDSTITTADTLVSTKSVGAIGPKQLAYVSSSVDTPTTPGTYYYGACVDAVSGESDTTNNCTSTDAVAEARVVGIDPNSPDRRALIALYNATNGPNWFQNTNWLSDKPLNKWHGVEATTNSDVVLSLYLYTNLLTGTIPSEFGNLSSLRNLEINHNNLTGELPSSLTNLSSLINFRFQSNAGLCAPTDAAFQNWLQGVAIKHGPNCSSSQTSAPGAPTGLTATADGQTEIDLSWTAPSDDGGATITGYKIEVSTNESSWSDLVANTRSTSTSYSHTRLTTESTRHYRVSAINSAGTGEASDTDSATTAVSSATDGSCTVDLIVRPGESCTYPGTSTEFSVDSDGNGQFLFTSAGSRIELRNTTINGVTFTFVASKQSDGNWIVEEVG